MVMRNGGEDGIASIFNSFYINHFSELSHDKDCIKYYYYNLSIYSRNVD